MAAFFGTSSASSMANVAARRHGSGLRGFLKRLRTAGHGRQPHRTIGAVSIKPFGRRCHSAIVAPRHERQSDPREGRSAQRDNYERELLRLSWRHGASAAPRSSDVIFAVASVPLETARGALFAEMQQEAEAAAQRANGNLVCDDGGRA